MSPNQTAIAILEYGKLLLDEHEHSSRAPNLSRLQQAEAQLIGRLHQDRSPSLKQVFGFNPRTSVDPVALRVLSHVAYLSLCTNCLGVSVSEVVWTLAGNDSGPGVGDQTDVVAVTHQTTTGTAEEQP